MKKLEFNSKFLNEIFNGNIVENFAFEKSGENYSSIMRAVEKAGQKQFELKTLVETMKNSRLFPLFNKTINSIKLDVIYKSHTHGICHIERTTFWAFCLSVLLKLNKRNCYLALILAMYHDTGRINDKEDRTHGKRSAEKLKNFGLKLSKRELNILQCIIEAHSINDNEFGDLLAQYGIKENKKIRTLFNILKDSDGLDRVRLTPLDIDPKFLRTQFSKQIILSAFTLKQIYDII